METEAKKELEESLSRIDNNHREDTEKLEKNREEVMESISTAVDATSKLADEFGLENLDEIN